MCPTRLPGPSRYSYALFHPLLPSLTPLPSLHLPFFSLALHPSLPLAFSPTVSNAKSLRDFQVPQHWAPSHPLNPSSQKLISPFSWGGDCSWSSLPPAILSRWSGPALSSTCINHNQPLRSRLSPSHGVALHLWQPNFTLKFLFSLDFFFFLIFIFTLFYFTIRIGFAVH